MKFIFDSYKKTGQLHHAYCIEGKNGDLFQRLCVHLEQDLDFPVRGNPDFWHGQYESLGIDDGRSLKEMQQNRSAGGGRKIFVVSADSITREAQNSMLKMFEEPTPQTHFFIFIPSAEILLPTLRSRLMIIGAEEESLSVDAAQLAKDFVKAPKAERLTLLKTIVEDKDKRAAFAFLDALEVELRAGTPLTKVSKERLSIFQELLKMKDYLHDRSASVKQILEHLALIV